jgi:hypothetical protein
MLFLTSVKVLVNRTLRWLQSRGRRETWRRTRKCLEDAWCPRRFLDTMEGTANSDCDATNRLRRKFDQCLSKSPALPERRASRTLQRLARPAIPIRGRLPQMGVLLLILEIPSISGHDGGASSHSHLRQKIRYQLASTLFRLPSYNDLGPGEHDH